MIPSIITQNIQPSETALLDWLRPQMSPAMIEHIAKADREEEWQSHLAAIMEQLGPTPRLGLPDWWPREVLELERWSDPDKTYSDRPPTGETGHLQRTLACTLLLRNAAYCFGKDSNDAEFFIDTNAGSVRQLVLSCFALGRDPEVKAAELLVWLYAKQAAPALRPFVALAIASLHLKLFAPRLGSESLEIFAWLGKEEATARAEAGRNSHSSRWLTGVSWYEDDAKQIWAWIDVAGRAFASVRDQVPVEVRDALESLISKIGR